MSSALTLEQYLSIDNSFDPHYFSVDNTFKAFMKIVFIYTGYQRVPQN
jgi:hypothetical protein